MGKAILKTFNVGAGDCIFLILENNGNHFSIMVDCGKLNDEVRNYIDTSLHRNLDLLIITHIDDDHIDGVKSILSEFDDLKIGHIIYNCAQGCQLRAPKVLPDLLLENLNSLRKTDLHVDDKGEVAALKALTLTEKLLSNENWRMVWQKQVGYVTTETTDLILPYNLGKLIFLSPEPAAIKQLDSYFRKTFNERLYDRYDGPYENESTIYEIILRYLLVNEAPNKSLVVNDVISVNSIKNLANINPPHSISPTNKASLAFLWECGESRILLCGDADPEVIVYNFLRKSNSLAGIAKFDAIKVAHHGSEHNCGAKFWDTFDSEHIFFTGADNHGKHPSRICISKVISRNTDKPRLLHFTKVNSSVKWIDEAPQQIKETLKYQITTDCTYEFEY